MNIYVGNLSFDETDESLEATFSNHGEVQSARVITDRYTGRSRGFGFVEMPNQEEALAAIAAMNGANIVRVHDVKHVKKALLIADAVRLHPITARGPAE